MVEIQQQTSGGKLHISFDLSTLINDPNFGPYYGVLAVAAATAWADLGGAYFADATQPTRWYLRTHILTPGQNTAPSLAGHQVIPSSGDTLTLFDFRVKYVDPQNNLPPVRRLYIDDTLSYLVGTPDHFYQDTSLFMIDALGPFSPGWHKYYFKFSDGEYAVTTPLDSFYVQGIYIAENHKFNKKEPIYTFLSKQSLSKFKDIRIFDLQGRKVISNHQIGKGIYFLKNKKKTRLNKVIILK